MEVTTKSSLGDMFKRNPEPCTQSSLVVDDFTQRAVTSSRFERFVTEIISRNLQNQVKGCEQKVKLPNNAQALPELSSSSSRMSVIELYSKHVRHHHAMTKHAPRGSKKHPNDEKKKQRRSTSSSECSMSATSSLNLARVSLLSNPTTF